MTIVWCLASPPAAAKSKVSTGRKFRIVLNGGYSMQAFGGVAGANRSQINHLQYGAGIFYRYRLWENGLAYSHIPGVKVDPFVFRNGTRGQYQMDFTRTEFLSGLAYGRFRLYALVGLEQIGWKGTPDLGAKSNNHVYFGGEAVVDFFPFRQGSRFSIPFSIRYLTHQERKVEFEQNPSENVTVSPGSETAVNLGVAVAF